MRERKWLVKAFAVMAVVTLVATACKKSSSSGPSQQGGVTNVKIAYIGALSGDYKLLVQSGYNAAALAFEQYNASQKKVNVTLVPEDSQGDPAQAPALVDKVVGDSSFVGVIGPAFSGESQAVGDRLNAAGIPFVTPSATNPGLAQNGWTHWFRGVGNDNSQGTPAAQYIELKVAPATCTFVASDGSTYGKGLADVVFNTLTGDGATVKPEQSVSPGQKDYSALVAKIAASGCEAVFYGGYSPEAGLIRKQMTQAGLSKVTFEGGDGIKDDTFLSTSGSAGDGTIAACPCADLSLSTDPAAQKFISDYTAKYGAAPSIYGPEGWDIAQMFIQAFNAGDLTRDSITSWFRGADYTGLTKEYVWEPNGELLPTHVVIYFYQDKAGVWQLLGPSTDVLAS